MPIASKRIMCCKRCYKEFSVYIGDNITAKDLNKLSQDYCGKCKIIMFLKGAKTKV